METYLLYAMLAGAVGVIGWWLTMLISAFSGDKRKIAQRLSNSAAKPSASGLATISVVLKEEASDIPAFLARKAYIQVISRKLAHAFPSMTLQRFLIISAIAAVLPAVVVGVVTQNAAATCGAFAIGGYLPLFLLNMRCKARLNRMIRQLPDALDFLSRVMRAGHSLSTGLQMMADELPQPLAGEFRRVYDQHSLGQSLEDALKEMAGRIELTDFSFFVTAVLIQRQTGGDLSEVLGNISTLIRQRMRLVQSVGAKTAEGKLTGYILVCFPILMFAICWKLNPDLYGGFVKDPTGKMLLGGAGALIVTGLIAIQKITKIEV